MGGKKRRHNVPSVKRKRKLLISLIGIRMHAYKIGSKAIVVFNYATF